MSLIDKGTTFQVICGLMKHPQYLSEVDYYKITIDDFNSNFEKYIFSAIYNLYKDGAEQITVVDIDNYLAAHSVAKAVFEQYNGIEVLQDALEILQENNFNFYYKRLKKFNCLRDFKKMGIDTSSLYCEDLTDDKAKEINDKFEELEISDLVGLVKKKISLIEANYSNNEENEARDASDNIKELLADLKINPEVGARLQGDIFNTVCRGARKGKFYIRTASSGVGKSRSAVGDACLLSYPVRFNTLTWEWEWNGSAEKTLFIATEQEDAEIKTLILSYLTGFNEEKILYGKYNEEEEKIIHQAVKVMERYNNLKIIKISNPSISAIKAVIRTNWINYNIENVFYDYIFSSPNLLSEFRDLKVREDVALGLLSTALKDLAVELGVFMMSSTQTNANINEHKNELSIRGARSIIDKCDIACIVSRVSNEELELLKDVIDQYGTIPNQVTDVYKNRRGKYTNIRIWSYVDLGTCRKQDLFITTQNFQSVEGFRTFDFMFDSENSSEIIGFLKELNQTTEETSKIEKKVQIKEEIKEEPIVKEEPVVEEKTEEGLFGGLVD